MRELRWYLERFLAYPFHPDTLHAEHTLDALKNWGKEVFNALFDRRDAGSWFGAAGVLQVRSDDPRVLSWPWEALYDPQAGAFVAHQRRVERRLNQVPDPPPLGQLPQDRVNILLVIARPYHGDVRYRSVSRPLIELIRSARLPAHVDVLRPPTFDQLREHLRSHPGYYHVLHFDGHGAYGEAGGQFSPDRFRSRQGSLVFENERGKADPKSAADLCTLLREHAVPAVVLNACQSGTLDDKTEDTFSTVATALLRSGVRSVVAMAYSLYVRGAQAFLPAFYRGLFDSRSVAEGVRAGRQQMLSQKKRMSAAGPYEFEDWLLPVLYQQAPLDFEFAAEAKMEPAESRLPPEVTSVREEYGFIGRDGPILEMERALHRRAPCFLIRGLGGVGKTRLARGFLRWLDETGGLDAALWFDFRDIRTVEYVLNRTGTLFYGENFGVAKNKLTLLEQALQRYRVVMVWDNFESTATALPAGDRAELGRFLEAIRATRGKVIMTSRAAEDWLNPSLRFELPLRGLDGEERWEYCDLILRELGKSGDQKDPELKKLMDQLGGHPLAMRVVLQKLERMSVASVSQALRNNLAELGLKESDEARLFATLRFVEQGLPENLKPVLPLVGLHETYLEANPFEAMAQQVDADWTGALIDQLMTALSSAGLLQDLGNGVYEVHPLLTSYLRHRVPASQPCQRAFVDIMARIANDLTPKPLHEQRAPFFVHGANLHHARKLSDREGMDGGYFVYLTQSLASYAQNSRHFAEAGRLFEESSQYAIANGILELEASSYHQLGRIAQEMLDFEKARHWYLKSLAISEKQGYLHAAAIGYHQMGRMAELQRSFEEARSWCLKALAVDKTQGDLDAVAISYRTLGRIAEGRQDFKTARECYVESLSICEKQGIQDGIAESYFQLGTIAEMEREFATAEGCYLKALAINEERGDSHGAAARYHHLGSVALQQGKFEKAREWYLKSVVIAEKEGIPAGAASSYHQLGNIALHERDFELAREWYLKALAIKEKRRDPHAAASSYKQLGILEGLRNQFEPCAAWLVHSISTYLRTNDRASAETGVRDFLEFFRIAPARTSKRCGRNGMKPVSETSRRKLINHHDD